MYKTFLNKFYILSIFVIFQNSVAQESNHLVIVGSGIIGAVEALVAYQEAQKEGTLLQITILEKDATLSSTAMNIAPSLSPDEIVAVVPPASVLEEKLRIPFNQPGGIRVDDVPGVNDSPTTKVFLDQVYKCNLNPIEHEQARTQALLSLGRMSMNLWQQIYDNADQELKKVFDESNYNPCRQSNNLDSKVLHDGYRIDLLSGISNATGFALGMKKDYESLGYDQSAILTPSEVIEIDPTLTHFCYDNAIADAQGNLVWKDTAVAIWRPGGCLFVLSFIPKLYDYLAHKMGENFQLIFSSKVVGLELTDKGNDKVVIGLLLENKTLFLPNDTNVQYVFAPGEVIGTLKNFGLCESAYAGFAGASLKLVIDIPQGKEQEALSLNHCMEVRQEGVVLAWLACVKGGKVFIAVAGTKAFYADQRPDVNQVFAVDRNLLQLNMINKVLPQYVSWALARDTQGQELTAEDLSNLESAGIAQRWVGVRAVTYDGFPTLGYVYTTEGNRVVNARCTTHLGSGGVSFAPAAVAVSRAALNENNDEFVAKILKYANSARTC